MEKPSITIPDLEKGASFAGMPAEAKKHFDKIETILTTVVIAVVIALISVVVAVFGIFLDQMRYNNAVYKEYLRKTESVESTQKANEALLKQIQELSEQNKEDRQIIIELQRQNLLR